jgi:RNA polymerase sigma factor (sigma-70 family)
LKATIPLESRTKALLVAAQAGDEAARSRLVADSLPLVEAVVAKQGRPDLHDDLLQAGCCGSSEGQSDGEPARAGGLLRAIETWQARKGVKWSTWATWWIRAGVQAELIKNGPMLGPNRRALKRRAKVRKVAAALEAQLGRRPETLEISAALKVPERDGIIEAAMRPLLKEARATADDGDRRLWEDLRSGNTPTPEQALDLRRQINRIRDTVMALPPLERVVIAGTFGIDSRELPQEALARVAGISGRTLRAVKARALEMLREQLGDMAVRPRDQDFETASEPVTPDPTA